MFNKSTLTITTSALVLMNTGVAGAASNPFSDVPADSWAYDAVSTLAADGVIDGYPDGTYQGQNTMTRYEMAQIVARAMAKTDLEKADKALVDKLAAEFAEELDNLGVRVADLEKKSDNVKWGGELRYRYYDENHDAKADETYNKVLFRLEPKAYIGNSGWTANARLDYEMDLSSDENDNNVEVDRAWVEGPLFGATVQAGRVPVFTAQGLLFDDRISGGTVAFGSDEFKTTLAAGRYSEVDHDPTVNFANAKDVTAEYYGVQFDYTPNDSLALNAGYTALTGIDASDVALEAIGYGSDNTANIWYVGGKYAFDKNVAFVGEYAQNTDADTEDQAWTAELQYKGANVADPGSWGMYAGYRQIETFASIAPTYDDIIGAGYKGAVVGAMYVPAENILATIEYFDGEETISGQDASKFFANVDFFF